MTKREAGRNRSQGWAHAKKSGHQNERTFGQQLLDDHGFLNLLEIKKFNQETSQTPRILVDGAKKVASIFGDQTTSKIDLEISWNEHKTIGVSIKKSSGGQVWLVSLLRFKKCLEHYTGSNIPKNAELALALFIGGANLENIQDKFDVALTRDASVRPKIYSQEVSQNRLVADSIRDSFPGAWEELMNFFSVNIGIITHLSFGRGLANSGRDWADFVIYNLVDRGEQIFEVGELADRSTRKVKEIPIAAGPKNGGSTVLLPTGFLQMHHPKGENLLQFHHSYGKIQAL